MTRSLRHDIETIFRAALIPVGAANAVRAHLSLCDDGGLIVDGLRVDIGPEGVYAVAIGKAAVAMVDAAAETAGEHFTTGLAVSKSEAPSVNPKVTVIYGSHPVPDERSLAAGDRLLRFAAGIPRGALVLCLISGGGSAVVEDLRDGVDLARLQELTFGLLQAGASIHELNAVRSRLSRIKAGGLLRVLAHARVHNLIVSDVLGDDLRTIATGPTVPTSGTDAEAVMQRYGMSGSLPTVRETDDLTLPPTAIAANLSVAIHEAARNAANLGYTPVVLSQSLDGEAREVGRALAGILADGAQGRGSLGPGTCLLAGGETTVTVRGDGSGGRNTEAALAAAIRISGVPNVAIGFLATDGDDGMTNAAGAVVDGETVTAPYRLEAAESLRQNDSGSFLRSRDAIVETGPSGTNVNDLVIGLAARNG